MLGGGQLIETSKIYSRENERKHRKPEKEGVAPPIKKKKKRRRRR
jgi:hypothetical protein